VIPDWDQEWARDFWGNTFFTVEGYIEFYLCGMRAFCDQFEIISVSKATVAEIEAAKERAADNWEDEFDYELLEALLTARAGGRER